MSIVSDAEARQLLNAGDSDVLLPLVRANAERLCKQEIGWDPERSSKTEYYPVNEFGGEEWYFPGTWGGVASLGGYTEKMPLNRPYVLASGLSVWESAGAYGGQLTDSTWTAITLGDDYVLDLDDANLSSSGHLVRLGGAWPRTRGSVKVTYTAGFTATELSGEMNGSSDYTNASDLKMAVLMAIAKAYNEIKAYQKNPQTHAAGPVTAETLPDYSYSMDGEAARAILGMSCDLPPAVKQILHRYSKRYAMVA